MWRCRESNSGPVSAVSFFYARSHCVAISTLTLCVAQRDGGPVTVRAPANAP